MVVGSKRSEEPGSTAEALVVPAKPSAKSIDWDWNCKSFSPFQKSRLVGSRFKELRPLCDVSKRSEEGDSAETACTIEQRRQRIQNVVDAEEDSVNCIILFLISGNIHLMNSNLCVHYCCATRDWEPKNQPSLIIAAHAGKKLTLLHSFAPKPDLTCFHPHFNLYSPFHITSDQNHVAVAPWRRRQYWT